MKHGGGGGGVRCLSTTHPNPKGKAGVRNVCVCGEEWSNVSPMECFKSRFQAR